MYLIVACFIKLEECSAIVWNAATFCVQNRHRNIEFLAFRISQIILHIEFEGILAGQHLLRDRQNTERRHTLAQP